MFDAAAALRQLRVQLRELAVSAQDTDTALEIAQFLGTINWHNTDGLLSEHDLELAIHSRHLDIIDRAASVIAYNSPRVDWLHVISSAADSGGHTQLLENLVTQLARDGYSQAVVVTRSATPRFVQAMKNLGVRAIQLQGPATSVAANLVALGRESECVVLHIHPDDATSALAARVLREAGQRVLFVNHADHVFSFGTSAACSVLEVSGFGWAQTNAERSFNRQSFLGIPLEVEHDQNLSLHLRVDASLLSIGGSNKYMPVSRPSFRDLLGPLLDAIPCTVDIIGVPPNAQWAKSIRRRYPDRVRLLGRLPYAQTFQRLRTCRIYLDSMPITGGTALSQALALGCQVYGLWQYGGGYGIVDTLRSRTLDDMVNEVVRDFDSRTEPPKFQEVRDRIATDENNEAVANRLRRAAALDCVDLPDHLTRFGKAADDDILLWRARRRVVLPLGRLRSVDTSTRASILGTIALHGGLLRAARTPLTYGRWLLTGHPS